MNVDQCKHASELVLLAEGEVAMESLGASLAQCAGEYLTLYLYGDLGMGKTTFSRGVLRGAGHQGSVKSPTYTLVEPYEISGRTLYHFDLYRLADPEELEYVGIRDYFDGPGLRLIEWPQRGAGLLPAADLELLIESEGAGRRLRFRAKTAVGMELLQGLARLQWECSSRRKQQGDQ